MQGTSPPARAPGPIGSGCGGPTTSLCTWPGEVGARGFATSSRAWPRSAPSRRFRCGAVDRRFPTTRDPHRPQPWPQLAKAPRGFRHERKTRQHGDPLRNGTPENPLLTPPRLLLPCPDRDLRFAGNSQSTPLAEFSARPSERQANAHDPASLSSSATCCPAATWPRSPHAVSSRLSETIYARSRIRTSENSYLPGTS